MARPTKWSEEIEEKATRYIIDYQIYGDMIPSIEGMAEHLELHRDTLYAWAKDKDKGFSDILGRCMQVQAKTLVNNGLNNTFNSAITKLVLGKHGYHDKMEQDITSSDGTMKPTIIELVGKVNE
tara:strand:+ start:79 stop:450 length:372 start_codon:yes stop_codon:yes gene_type:complete